MQEQAGRPFMGQAAEAIKERVTTLDHMKEMIDSLDMEDEDTWAVHINNTHAMFMAQAGQLPALAHGLAELMVEVVKHADEQDQMLGLATRMAIAKCFKQAYDNEEVTDHEDDNS